MRWLNRMTRKKAIVGIEILTNAIAVVVRGVNTGDIEHADFLLSKDSQTFNIDSCTSLMRTYVEKYNLQNSVCRVVLPSQDYQLILVDAPDVPESEMREAIRWRIKDLISISITNAVIDIFKLPSSANRAGKQMMYVVVADIKKIQSIISIIRASNLRLSSIDIGELSLRNLTLAHNIKQGLAVARVREGSGSVSIFHDGELYLSRQFQLNYQAGLLDELPDEPLALEVQRSLDYYERQMGQSPPAYLYLCGDSVSEDKITQDLIRGVNIPVKYFSLREALSINTLLDEGVLQVCVSALGTLYRQEAA